MVLHMIIKQLQKHIVSRVGIFSRNYVGIKYMYFQHGQIQGTAVYNSWNFNATFDQSDFVKVSR